ncbi:MAG: undecaprenyl-diphosphate phosphatase [Candidatus Marinimicrobia bacterium]|nr:undecaprenyl-diphosphate phosphatase [bacterium]MCG2716920.1 undecaprenyl-diphosphate phosphatase [Candidatus Neomarinimicrobiota bacterium]
MGYIDAIILGIVQGLTEFLPISSSGHLVIFQHLLGISSENIAFEVIVHFGTLLSVVAVYYIDIRNMIVSFFSGVTRNNIIGTYQNDPYFQLSIFVIIGTIPAVIAGLFLKDFFVSVFHNVRLVGITLLVTGGIILSTRLIRPVKKQLSIGSSFLIGIAQSIAILPGISRSGFTISSALIMGVSRENAARFSFLLAVPAILGATLLHIIELTSSEISGIGFGTLFTGFIFSFVVGYIAIRFLLSILKSGKFGWFAPYCFLAGLIVLIFIK